MKKHTALRSENAKASPSLQNTEFNWLKCFQEACHVPSYVAITASRARCVRSNLSNHRFFTSISPFFTLIIARIITKPTSLYSTYLVAHLPPSLGCKQPLSSGVVFCVCVFPAQVPEPGMAGWVCGHLWSPVLSTPLPCSSPQPLHL